MASTKALWVSNNLKLGQSGFGKYGQGIGSVKQITHDGDTVNTLLLKNLGVRFLGIDTPEISFQLPGETNFTHLSSQKWNDLFQGPWKAGLPIGPGLLNYLEDASRIGINRTDVGTNHHELAKKAEESLQGIIEADLEASGRANHEFLFFMAFAHDFLDGYGRLLTYLNSDRENYLNGTLPNQLSYNERQLATGWAVPYFIWPNVQPFLSIKPFSQENVTPLGFWSKISSATKLNISRQAVGAARANGLGIYDPANPLRVMPFELRFICRKAGPERYLVDLTDTGGNTLLHPEKYYMVNPEDRLFIPAEYVPIFESYGWVRG